MKRSCRGFMAIPSIHAAFHESIVVLASLLLQVAGTGTYSHEVVAPPTAVQHVIYLGHSNFTADLIRLVRRHTNPCTNASPVTISLLMLLPFRTQNLTFIHIQPIWHRPDEPILDSRRKNDRARLSKSSSLRTRSDAQQRKKFILVLISKWPLL